MTNLSRLKVSLTKHGAHKVAELVRAFPKDEIRDRTWGAYKGVHIDRAQTARNLSVDPEGRVPDIWDEVRALGAEAVNSLVLLAIIFSHHQLINAMMAARTQEMTGTVIRGQVINGKAYTNFACILQELGFATYHDTERVSYDLNRMYKVDGLWILAKKLLALKLKTAGWDGTTDLIDECVRLELHRVFGIPSERFVILLRAGLEEEAAMKLDEAASAIEFAFKSGHNPKLEGEVEMRAPREARKANLLHNEIQNRLYDYLASIYGEDAVGTEVPCGHKGAAVDVVIRQGTEYVFYEIKTEASVRNCIRQAIPQLLEYAYWPDKDNAKQLIIVSQNPIGPHDQQYLAHLRDRFGVPLYYQQFNLKEGRLESRN